MLIDDGLSTATAAGWRRRPGTVPVPPTIQALLAARLDQLGRRGAGRGRSGERSRARSSSRLGRASFPEAPTPRRRVGVAGAQGADPARHPVFADERGVPLPPPADPGRRVRVDAEGGARCAARTARRVVETKAGDRSVEYDEIVGYHLEQAFRYRAELGSDDDGARELGARAADCSALPVDAPSSAATARRA